MVDIYNIILYFSRSNKRKEMNYYWSELHICKWSLLAVLPVILHESCRTRDSLGSQLDTLCILAEIDLILLCQLSNIFLEEYFPQKHNFTVNISN